MKAEEFASLDATALSNKIRDGDLSPSESVVAALEIIDARNPELNAVILIDRQGALAAAEKVDRKAPPAGVPVLIKDNNLYVEDWPTT